MFGRTTARGEMRVSLGTLGALALATALAGTCGCSQGSRPAQVAQAGPVSELLPAGTRAGAGAFRVEAPLDSLPGGAVTALEALPQQPELLAAVSPFDTVQRVDPAGIAAPEVQLGAPVSSFAARPEAVLLATRRRGAPGAGTLWEREGGGAWTRVLATSAEEMVVAWVGADFYGVSGSLGGDARVWYRGEGAADFAPVAGIPGRVPTAAMRFLGELWIGTGDARQVDGGAAQLYRGRGASFQRVELPVSRELPGLRQEVTALLWIPRAEPAAPTFLAVAVGSFDREGNPRGGSVSLTHDGETFETLSSYVDDAPLALAYVDRTLQIGTAQGRLQYRRDDGSVRDEPAYRPAGAVGSLLAREGELIVGRVGEAGPELLRRAAQVAPAPAPAPPPAPGPAPALSATPAPAPAPGPASPAPQVFADVQPTLVADCRGCHGNGLGGLTIDGSAGDLARVLARLNLADPAGSLILRKPAEDGVSHGGGQLAGYAVGAPKYQLLLGWIEDGAPAE